MRLISKLLAFVCVCAFACVALCDEKAFTEEPGRQEIVFDRVGDWCNDVNRPFADFKDGEFSVRHNVHFFCAYPIKIKTGKKYSFSAEVVSDSKLRNPVMLGFVVCSSLGQRLHGKHYIFLADSLTELVAPTTEEQDFILVKKNAKWLNFNRNKQLGYMAVAFNAKADDSDLPNKEVSSLIKSIEEQGDVVKVIFEKKLYAEYPAGTAVRIHQHNRFYREVGRVFPNEQWQTVGGTFELPAKAEYFLPCLIYYGPKDKVVKYRNLRLVVE